MRHYQVNVDKGGKHAMGWGFKIKNEKKKDGYQDLVCVSYCGCYCEQLSQATVAMMNCTSEL